MTAIDDDHRGPSISSEDVKASEADKHVESRDKPESRRKTPWLLLGTALVAGLLAFMVGIGVTAAFITSHQVRSLIGATARAPFAHADSTMDPHIPNPLIGWCPGGGSGGISGYGFCDGVRYPDGSYWHVVRGNVPFAGPQMRMDCVIDNGSPVPPLAPPGGCGGAVH